jgi:hypothetical protein
VSERVARNIVRSLVAVVLGAAVFSSALSPVPDDLPAPAFGQPGLYRMEVALLVFYGCPALVTPAFSALTSGQLPIEISTRGAKFAERAEQSTERELAIHQDLEEATNRLGEELAMTLIENDRLRQGQVTEHDQR